MNAKLTIPWYYCMGLIQSITLRYLKELFCTFDFKNRNSNITEITASSRLSNN